MSSAQKNIVCPLDGRKFATKRALQQHQQSHSKAPRQQRQVQSKGVALSLPSAVRPTPMGSCLRQKGQDVLVSGSLESGATLQYEVSALALPRLSEVSKTWQRIRFHSLTLTLTAKTSATESGGYVVGFVADPEDYGMTERRLLANQGAVSRKWWETCRVPAHTSLNQLYYVNEGRSGLRWVSPGAFWLMTQGEKASFVTLTIEWDVSFFGPTLEREEDSRHLISNGYLKAAKGHEYFVDSKGEADLRKNKPFNWLPTGPAKFYWYRLENTVGIQYREGVGDVGTINMHFAMYSVTTGHLYWAQDSLEGQDTTQWDSSTKEQILIPHGARLIYEGCSNDTKLSLDFRQNSGQSYEQCPRGLSVINQGPDCPEDRLTIHSLALLLKHLGISISSSRNTPIGLTENLTTSEEMQPPLEDSGQPSGSSES